jgi:hypothetical protein
MSGTVVVVVDPGESTGVIVACLEEKTALPTIIEATTIPLWRGLQELIAKYQPACIVAEEFRLRAAQAKAQAGSYMPSSQVLGVLTFLAEHADIPLVEQSASFGFQRGRVRSDEEKALFDALGTVHEQAAFHHLLAYVRAQGGK